MKLLSLLTAAALPLLLTSCYTDGYGYVETGSYYPRHYGSYYPGYYPGAGYYGHLHVQPRYYSHHRSHYGRNWRRAGDWDGRYRRASGSTVSAGWTGYPKDRRWR